MQTRTFKGSHLSLQQARLWPLRQNGLTYQAFCALRLKGRLDVELLRLALQQIVSRHEILRTTFFSLPEMDVPLQRVQRVTDSLEIPWNEISLEEVSPAEQEAELSKLLIRCRFAAPVKEQAPLWVTLVRLRGDHYVLVLSLLPLCADAPSLSILATEIARVYASLASGKTEEWEEQLQYSDVADWQRELLQEQAAEHQAFWQRIDLAQINRMRLPFVSEELVYVPEHFSFRSTHVVLDPATSSGLLQQARLWKTSSTVLLLTAWHLLLQRLTGEIDRIPGVMCDGRHYEELEQAIGLYSRVVPLLLRTKPEQRFIDCVRQVQGNLERAVEEQSYFTYPTSTQMPAINFPVQFESLFWPTELQPTSELRIFLQEVSCQLEPCALKLRLLEREEILHLDLYYDPQYLREEQVERLASSLRAFLQGILDRPESIANALPLLDTAGKERIKQSVRGLRRDFPQYPLHELFEHAVRQYPDYPAVTDTNQMLTYRQLSVQSNQMAHLLLARGVSYRSRIAFCLPRSIEALICLLAILKIGGTYIPLDPDTPQKRLIFYLQDSQAELLLTTRAHLSSLTDTGPSLLCLEDLSTEMGNQPSTPPEVKVSAEDLAYVIYTSGSTGQPKGVAIMHRGVMNYIHAMLDILGAASGRQFGCVSTLAADLGNTSIFCSLVTAGCLHLLPTETVTSSERFRHYVEEHPLDVLKIVPSHLQALLSSEAGSHLLPQQHLILGGEPLPVGLLRRLAALKPTCQLLNHYGPTEGTIGSLVHNAGMLSPQMEWQDSYRVPLGCPLANTEAYILDAGQQLVPAGVVGELYLGGAGVAAGYLNQPELTQERFIFPPWNAEEKTRLYRTGDLVRYTDDHLIEFVGRSDEQVKLHGYRIELGEVEKALQQHPSLYSCAVVLSKQPDQEPRLIAYVVGKQTEEALDGEALRHFLAEQLPTFMIPSTFISLEALPLTANGKVDRQQLKDPDRQNLLAIVEQRKTEVPFVRPRDDIEFQLQRIWEDLLHVQQLSVIANFFEYGGHSILAVRLMSRIYKQFNYDLALSALFEHPTIAELASLLRRSKPVERWKALVPIKHTGSKRPFFCVHPSGGTVFRYYDLAQHLGPEQPFYGLQSPEFDEEGSTFSSIENLAAHYVEAIQTVQLQGPYLLGGWSSGGIMACEMARQLHAQGEETSLLALLDSNVPTGHIKDVASPDTSDTALAYELLHALSLPIQEDFAQQPPLEQLRYALIQARQHNVVPIDTDLQQLRRFARIQKINRYAIDTYVPRVYPCRITLFIASGLEQADCTMLERPEYKQLSDSWSGLTSVGMEVHMVPGKHTSILDVPYVQELASALKQCIDHQHLTLGGGHVS